MPSNRKIRGEVVNHNSPNWSPLQKLVGMELAGGFMWMYEVELRNRTRLHVYKHCDTRAYLHLDMDARCFAFEDESSYRQITQYQAVMAVFRVWDGGEGPCRLTPRERAALDFTREHASLALLEPGELSPLDDKADVTVPGRFLASPEPDSSPDDGDWGGDDAVGEFVDPWTGVEHDAF